MFFIGGFVPLFLLLYRFYRQELTANPIEYLERQTGYWGLVFLLATLTVTPLRRWLGGHFLIRVRRMLGLFSYLYIFLHFIIYLFLDRELYMDEIIPDIVKRPYITVGFSAFIMLSALAVTSSKRWIRRLGGKWQTLHRLIYPAALLGVLHFWWLVKADIRQPAIFAAVFTLLMLARLKKAS